MLHVRPGSWRFVLCVCALTLPTAATAQRGTVEARVTDAVCDKEIVVLGELPSHGEAQAFEVKARIVERLVERCGFDALLFEAPVYDFIGFGKAVARGTAEPAGLDRSIGRFWWTRELAEWRGWLFRRAASGRLVLGGLDDQVSATSEYARATLPRLIGASLPAPEAPGCEQAVARNLHWRYGAGQEFDEPERIRLERCARLAVDALAATGAGTAERVMAGNLASYFARQRGSPGAPGRDEVMYRNLLWHRSQLPAGSKLIVWTATVHAARRQGTLPEKPLGAWLAERWGRRAATIGFSALAGQSSMAGTPAKPLHPAPPGSLEAHATGAAARVFLDARALRGMGSVPSRLFGTFTTARWSDHFDGVIVIRAETAPTFAPWR